MPDGGTALAVGGSVLGASSKKKAAKSAAQADIRAQEMAIEEQRRQFDETVELLRPFVETGQEAMYGLQPYTEPGLYAMEQQAAIAGLMGPEAQAAQIAQIESDPLYQATVRQGEEAILQQASATGGLRGGNIQGALAQFRPQMLREEIDKTYGRLGGFTALGQGTQLDIARLGQAAAAGQAQVGQTASSNIQQALANQGAAQAGYRTARGQAQSDMIGGLAGILGGLF
jgi:hypothetical protein